MHTYIHTYMHTHIYTVGDAPWATAGPVWLPCPPYAYQTHIYMCVCVYVCMYVYIYTWHTYIHIYAYIHTYTYRRGCSIRNSRTCLAALPSICIHSAIYVCTCMEAPCSCHSPRMRPCGIFSRAWRACSELYVCIYLCMYVFMYVFTYV